MSANDTSRPIVLVAACALIRPDRRLLLAERPAGKPMAGLWEFPGGKIEKHESPEAALARELDEELGISVRVADLVPAGFASHDYGKFHLLMPLFLCRDWRGEPRALDAQDLAWVALDEIQRFAMPPADEPLVEQLRERLE